MRLAVFGANGGSGRALVRQALDAGHSVAAVSRHPEEFGFEHPLLEVVGGDVRDEPAVARIVKGKDAVLSSLGVPYTFAPVSLYSAGARHLVEGMRRHGVDRLVVVSSSAVDTEAGSQNLFFWDHVMEPFLTRFVGRTAYDDMRRMESVVRASGFRWTILRPPALFDAPAVGRYDASTSFLRGLHASRQDLAAAMLAAVVEERFVNEVAYVVSHDGSPSVLQTIWNDAVLSRLPRRFQRNS